MTRRFSTKLSRHAEKQDFMNLQKISFILWGGLFFLLGMACTEAACEQAKTDIPPAGATTEFSTDFSKHNVPYTEILSGGPPKDGIPGIDTPQFVTVNEADEWLKKKEPVIFFKINDDVRAYPIQILIWHEIVNDVVADVPVVISFCPLCNTAIVFERQFEGQVFDFGTTGRLRYSNLIMYDRQTETWWQQATGEAIAGELTGSKLKFLPAAIISWNEFKTSYPEGNVLSQETGHLRNYGQNPYLGYDDIDRTPFLYHGPVTEGKLLPMARVATVELGNEAVAYPYEILRNIHVINDTVGGESIVVFWQKGTVSALDTDTVASGRDVGAINTYSRLLNGQILTFTYKKNTKSITDDQTGSTWNVLGHATMGELAGQRLTPIVNVNHFWFSWAAFKPETQVYQP